MKISDYIAWFKEHWAKAGPIVSIYLLIFLFAFVLDEDIVLFALLLQTPLYMLHQTEEYVFPGGFADFFNRDIFKLKTSKGPLDQNFIVLVNITIVWVLLPLFGLLARINIELGLWIPYFTFFAGIAHILLALRARKLYNPGLIVSLLVNIPAGLWAISVLTKAGHLSSFWANPHFAIGLAVNAMLPVMGVILLRRFQAEQAKGN